MLVSFGNRTQAMLTARERGQRVITFVENRVRNAGLGLQNCKAQNDNNDSLSSKAVRNALDPLTRNDTKSLLCVNSNGYMKLPVAVSYNDNDNPYKDGKFSWGTNNKTKSDNSKIQYGNILTVLYAQREDGNNVNLVIMPYSGDILQSMDIKLGTKGTLKFLDSSANQIQNCDFRNIVTPFVDKNSDDIRVWAVLSGTGVPIRLCQESTQKDKVNFKAFKPSNSVPTPTITIHAGDELLYLKCDRMYVNNDGDGERNFYFNTLGTKSGKGWSDSYPHEKGILGIYFELDTVNNILDLWVLATGGKDSKRHDYPSEWAKLKDARPTQAQWNSNYQYEITYVSHASWKLHNIPKDFNWDS